MSVPLRELVVALDDLYPPALAEPWDAVGLVTGDPDQPVDNVLFALDPLAAVAEEAAGAFQLLVVHHPLYLGGTSSVAADHPKGRVLHRLVRAGCALFVAHTNADKARPGVSDALGELFGLRDTQPLVPDRLEVEKLTVFVPAEQAERIRTSLAEAGAGRFGGYDSCAFESSGTGTFRPLERSAPFVGTVGRLERVPEVRLEVLVTPAVRAAVLSALHASHPYEVPAFDLVSLTGLLAETGLGRVGDLPAPVPFRELVDQAARVLPRTAWGVRGSGDPDRLVGRLAVLGGAGDDALEASVAAGAEALLTSDLRHHKVLEAPEGLALLDAAHWATETPWLAAAARLLAERTGVSVSVSTVRTDPWTTASR